MNILQSLFYSKFTLWLLNATEAELHDAYETERLDWLKAGAGEKTKKMIRINDELNRRVEIELSNNPVPPRPRWTDANRWDND